jgi:hypothetical protein
LGTAEATINAIQFREARVVAKRKRPRSPRQSVFVQHPIVWGWSPEAEPAVRCSLDALHKAFERGKPEALLTALDLCARCDYKLPRWVRGGTLAALEKWFSYEVRTLGEAFGVPPHVSKHLDGQRKRNALRWRVITRVEQLRQGMPVDVRLFNIVDDEINQGAGYASKLYYDEASAGLRKILRNLKIS